ncbi:hypothetical protein, partial [Desulfatibacillum alkenivorans]|uniref:hypothetical protein n=1 Tax=Desulfatibacillum alkenivorans TaxID=259354 RepID=UPI001B8D58F7
TGKKHGQARGPVATKARAFGDDGFSVTSVVQNKRTNWVFNFQSAGIKIDNHLNLKFFYMHSHAQHGNESKGRRPWIPDKDIRE